MKLTINMPWEKDLSVNHMRFGVWGGYRKKPHVQAWMERLSWTIKAFHALIVLPAAVSIDFRWPDKRRRDTHNYFKAIADAVALGLGIDDKDILMSARSAVVDRENPGFNITIIEQEEP